MAKKNALKCSLRKTCKWCNKKYGRKLRSSQPRTPYLESVSSFLKSKYCSDGCRDKAVGQQKREQAAKEREKVRLTNEVLPGAFAMFLGIKR